MITSWALKTQYFLHNPGSGSTCSGGVLLEKTHRWLDRRTTVYKDLRVVIIFPTKHPNYMIIHETHGGLTLFPFIHNSAYYGQTIFLPCYSCLFPNDHQSGVQINLSAKSF